MNLLALLWVGIIGFGIILYVILDGFDLGIGILSVFMQDEHDVDLMVSTILPVWDGNETWLVFGGAALYGAFPLAFSTLLPAIYIPILLMVVSLLFRGVSFEFRLKAVKSKRFWDFCFFAGSLVAAFAQGIILGTFVQGFQTSPNSEALALYQWLNPFGLFCGAALVFGYTLLGSNRLIVKTTGHLQATCFKFSAKLQYALLFCAIIASVWSPYLDPDLSARWFNPSYMPYFAILPLITLGLFYLHWRGINKQCDHLPFWSSVGIFVLCFVGFIISTYPYLVPRHITFEQAATTNLTLSFMSIGAAIMLPVLLYYTYYSYKIFSGKVTEKITY